MLILDQGSRYLKVLELKRVAGKHRIVRSDLIPWLESEEDCATSNGPLPENAVRILLNGKLGLLKSQQPLSLVVSTAKATTRQFAMPAADPEALYRAVGFEMSEQLKLPGEELYWGYRSKSIEHSDPPQRRILAAATKRKPIQGLLDQLKAMKFDVQDLQISSLSAFHLVSSLFEEGETAGVLDWGAEHCTLTLGNREECFFTRSLNFGGESLTKALAEDLEISIDEAERYKKEQFILTEESVWENCKRVKKWFEEFLAQLKISLRYGRESCAGKPPVKLFCVGGSAEMQGLPEFLAAALGLPVDRPDLSLALSRLGIEPDSEVSLSPAYVAALGAAAQSLEPQTRDWNLLPPSEKIKSIDKSEGHWMDRIPLAGMVAILCAILVGGFLVQRYLTYYGMRERLNDTQKVQQEIRSVENELAALKEIEREKLYWSGWFMYLSQTLPKDAIINELSFGLDQDIILRNKSGSNKNMAKLVQQLEESIYLKNVQIRSTSPDKKTINMHLVAEPDRGLRKPYDRKEAEKKSKESDSSKKGKDPQNSATVVPGDNKSKEEQHRSGKSSENKKPGGSGLMPAQGVMGGRR